MKLARYTIIPFLLLIIVFYFWTSSNGLMSSFKLEKNYNFPSRHIQIAEAFLHKQTYILESPKEELLALSDPYDPNLNDHYRVHDASLYKGKYYQYFSPAVSILINIPIKVTTGYYPKDPLIGAFLCSMGLIFNILILFKTLNLLNIAVSQTYKIYSLFALSFASNIPFFLRRVDSYEICIAGGYCCLMIGIYSLICALSSNKIKLFKFCLFGLFMGLTIANRPNLILIVGFIYLILSIYLIKSTPLKQSLKIFIISFVPIVVTLILLGLYNYIRFDSIFEFGLRYQLAGIDTKNVPPFSFKRIPLGLFVYLFQPFSLDLIFPFFHAIYPIEPESDLSKIWFTEPTIGLFALPIFWLIPMQFFLANEIYKANRKLFLVTASFIAMGTINLIFASGLMGVTMRYTLEFLPLLLTGLLLAQPLYVDLIFDKYPKGVKVGNSYFYILIVITCTISFFLSLSGYLDSLKKLNPRMWDTLKNFFTAFI